MKGLFLLSALAATSLAQTSQTANFTNTSFTGPFTMGQTVDLMWTTGNGLPISLTIANSTWSYQVFVGRAVVPTSYAWIVAGPAGFAPGSYQLALQQVSGSTVISPVFSVVAAGTTTATSTTSTTTMTTTMAAATVTFVYWDPRCGCTKTGSALTPLNTSLPVTTTRWWDAQCGCHISTTIPITTLPAANNYTVPSVAPPLITTTPAGSATQTPPMMTSTTAPATYKGGAVRLEGSFPCALAMIAAMVLA